MLLSAVSADRNFSAEWTDLPHRPSTSMRGQSPPRVAYRLAELAAPIDGYSVARALRLADASPAARRIELVREQLHAAVLGDPHPWRRPGRYGRKRIAGGRDHRGQIKPGRPPPVHPPASVMTAPGTNGPRIHRTVDFADGSSDGVHVRVEIVVQFAAQLGISTALASSPCR